MTTSEVRAAAGELTRLHKRFAPLFGRREPREQSLIYLHGLLSAPGARAPSPWPCSLASAATRGSARIRFSVCNAS